MENKVYNEEEKNSQVERAIYINNKAIFDMIKEHIDILITERLIDFYKSNISIFQCKEHSQNSIDHYKE